MKRGRYAPRDQGRKATVTQVSVSVWPDEKALIKALAKAWGMSASDAMRRLMAKGVDHIEATAPELFEGHDLVAFLEDHRNDE